MQNPLSWAQVAALALAGGFPPGAAVVAVSITEPESARIQDNIQQGQPYATTGWGLWQITPGNSEPQFGIDDAMLNGLNNAHAAHAKWSAAGGFSPWTTWANGLNQPFLPDAFKAVDAVTKLPVSQLHKLINSTAGQPGSSSFTLDAAIVRIDAKVKRLFRQIDKDIVWQSMAFSRIAKPGWLP